MTLESNNNVDALTQAAAGIEQPAAVATLSAALASGPSHAYALIGPAGSGKRALARAFAAELLALGEADAGRAAEARRRALADPSPHPDLVWLRPVGTQHLVEEVREQVISAVSYRPFESLRRVFVIEAADALAPESQNALLKTLEEPPGYAHLILLSAEPAALLPTVRSRCAEVPFAPPPPATIERLLAAGGAGPPERLAAAALLCDGDVDRARMLAAPEGEKLRAAAEACARGARADRLAGKPWQAVLKSAAEAGALAAKEVEIAAAARAEEVREEKREAARIKREGGEAAKRADRRRRTASIDLALALAAAWFADLMAIAEGAGDVIRNVDRRSELEAEAAGLDGRAARRAAEVVMDTRRRLQVNVSEELALEATFHRCAAALRG